MRIGKIHDKYRYNSADNKMTERLGRQQITVTRFILLTFARPTPMKDIVKLHKFIRSTAGGQK